MPLELFCMIIAGITVFAQLSHSVVTSCPSRAWAEIKNGLSLFSLTTRPENFTSSRARKGQLVTTSATLPHPHPAKTIRRLGWEREA